MRDVATPLVNVAAEDEQNVSGNVRNSRHDVASGRRAASDSQSVGRAFNCTVSKKISCDKEKVEGL
jgi:hypothetical protein